MGSHKEPSRHEKQLVALGRSLQALREGDDADALVRAALGYIQSEFNYGLIWIGIYDRVAHALHGQHSITPTGDPLFKTPRFVMQPGDLLEQVVIQQRPVGVPDLREETRAGEWRDIAQRFDIQGTIIFPIRYRDQCIGVAVLGSEIWGVSPQSEEKARLSIVLGELAAAFCQLETERQQSQVKDPMSSVTRVMSQLRTIPFLEQRIEAIVKEVHEFTHSDRTTIYWFDPQRRVFWRRASQQTSTNSRNDGHSPPEIPVEEVSSFYQALVADQIVSVGEAQSSLRVDMTGRLMQKLQAQSLLAAPILFHDQLLGFLDLEGTQANVWSTQDKNYLQIMAQLAAMTSPLETMEDSIQQIKLDQVLSAEVTQAIYDNDDWNRVLNQCAAKLCERLSINRFLVLLYDADQEKFEICYQNSVAARRPIPSSLERLNQVDWQMLERSNEAVGIENLAEDLKLMAWRDVLLDEGVQSLMVCSTSSSGKPLEGLLVIAHDATRTWNRDERDLVRVVSRQIGVILHQWQLQRESEQQQKAFQTIQWGLSAMQQIHDLEQLEHEAMQKLSRILQVPLAAILSWSPGHSKAKVAAAAVANNQFTITAEKTVSIHTDHLIQWALQTDGVFPLSRDDLTQETQLWLSGSGIGQILVMALRTAPEHQPTGIVLVADRLDRYWPERQLDAFSTLVSQLAWSRRYLLLTEQLMDKRQNLERLNWYKQRYIEELYRTLGTGIRRLNDLSHQKDALASMRYHQILRQFGDTLSSMVPILKKEQWQINQEYATIPLASLLRRSIERVEHLIKQRQLWSQVHNEEALMVGGDIPKLEFVMYEVLLFACRRSPHNGRLDLWCRPLDEHWLELSITDNGLVEPLLVEELCAGRKTDLLAPSTLDTPPGLHLEVCQILMKQLGGEFNLYKLEDGRTLSRLVIAIAIEPPLKKSSKTRTAE